MMQSHVLGGDQFSPEDRQRGLIYAEWITSSVGALVQHHAMAMEDSLHYVVESFNAQCRDFEAQIDMVEMENGQKGIAGLKINRKRTN